MVVGSFELVLCEQTILSEISDPAMKRKDVALTYALALKSSEAVDWGRVNRAILERWSPAGLKWIKETAWRRAGRG